ncbi:MAG: pyridoxal-dependent decarboxylase, partial [Bacteroidota bacterium]
MNSFDFTPKRRKDLLQFVHSSLEDFYANTKDLSVSSDWNFQAVKAAATTLDLEDGQEAISVVEHLIQGLKQYAVHTPHPNYFGLFNPRANFSAIVGDLITATLNPQLAAWSHAPFANEIENHLIQEFGQKFGYQETDGTFCSGGAESNLTAVICALNHHFPNFRATGVRGIAQQPIIYCSSESHHSIAKAARITGLGMASVKSIPVNDQLQMDIPKLKAQIQLDRKNGSLPFMLIGTAGTTGAGAIDDLETLALLASEEKVWFHVDAAYGGAVVISEQYKSLMKGIEWSDSITLDLHKWFSVPMGASIFLTSKKRILHQAFQIKTKYMPDDGDTNIMTNPYIHSVQWSRRFIGLKIYMPLAIHGWSAYEALINHQIGMMKDFKHQLLKVGWKVLNHTQLPIACFNHPKLDSNDKVTRFVDRINTSGKVWLSTYPINGQN